MVDYLSTSSTSKLHYSKKFLMQKRSIIQDAVEKHVHNNISFSNDTSESRELRIQTTEAKIFKIK